MIGVCFLFNDTATTESYTLSLHDALPIYYATPGQLGSLTYADHLRDYLRRVRPFVLSYDHYHFLQSGDRPGFFANLAEARDRKSTRLNSSHANISYAVFCLKKKNNTVQSH